MSDDDAINPNGWLQNDLFTVDSNLSILLQFDDVSTIRSYGHRFRARRDRREALDRIIHGLKTNRIFSVFALSN